MRALARFGLILLIGLTGCVPEAGEALRLHDVAIFSNAKDLRGLYGYLYGAPGSVSVVDETLTLTEDVSEGLLSVPSALSVNGEPYIKQVLPKLSPPPSRVQRVPLTSDVELELGQNADVSEIVYFDGGRWFTLIREASGSFERIITPRLRAGGLQGLGQLSREEAEALETALEPRAPIAVTVMNNGIRPRNASGLEEYLSTTLYVQQTAPMNEAAFTPTPQGLIYEPLAQGNQAVAEESEEFIFVTSEAQFLELWNRAYGNQLDVPPLPNVNFEREAILAIFAGQKPTGGYGVEVEDVQLERGDVYIDLTFSEPAEDAISTQALTSPWIMLRVLRADINAAWFRDAQSGDLLAVARRSEE